MSEVRERFDANNELKEYFMSGIKKTTGIISAIKEEADIRNKLTELQRQDLDVTEQVKSLKISLKLVQKEKIKLKNKEETQKSLEEIIFIKEEELKKIDNEIDKLKSQLVECTVEREEYENYINFLYDLADEHDFVGSGNINFEELSRNEFIAYLFVRTNIGTVFFPGYIKKSMPEILYEVIDAIDDASENGWDSFIKWIEEN